MHTGQIWTVGFCGLHPRLRLPARRTRPAAGLPAAAAAPRVPAGAVGLADSWSGIYPRPAPAAGNSSAIRKPSCGTSTGRRQRCSNPVSRFSSPRGIVIFVEQTGPLALIEDLGRPGLAHLGVSPSGAADRPRALANRLVGNPEDGAMIEVTLGGLIIVARQFHWAAITGPLTQLWSTIDRRRRTRPSPSTPVTASGWTRRRRGPQLPRRSRWPAGSPRSSAAVPPMSCPGWVPHRSDPGYRSSWATGPFAARGRSRPPQPPSKRLAAPQVRAETGSPIRPGLCWRKLMDRVRRRGPGRGPAGGPRLDRRITQELPSEGLIRGAIQVPSAGQPLIFLADHPVTGGYPVIAC